MRDTKQIRKELKDTLGYNARKVSVSLDCNTLYFTIRDYTVDIKAVKKFTAKYEEIQRDHATGEILCGGNTFITVQYSEKVKDHYKSVFMPALKKAESQIKDNNIIPIDGTDYRLSTNENYHGRPDGFLLWKNNETSTMNNFFNLKYICYFLGETYIQEKKDYEPKKAPEVAKNGQDEEKTPVNEPIHQTTSKKRTETRRQPSIVVLKSVSRGLSLMIDITSDKNKMINHVIHRFIEWS